MDTDTSKSCLTIILILALLPLMSIFDGWVLTILWRWFVMPAFGVKALPLVLAIGLVYTIGYLTHQGDYVKKEYKVDAKAQVVGSFVRSAIVLGIGYIVHLFL